MDKNLIRLIVIGLIVVVFQVLFSSNFSFFGYQANYFLSFIILFSLKYKSKYSLIILYLFGLLFDVLNPISFGLNSLSVVIIHYFIKRYSKMLNKRHLFSYLLFLLFSNVVYFLLILFYYTTSLYNPITSEYFILFIYNYLCSIISFLIIWYLYLVEFRINDQKKQ